MRILLSMLVLFIIAYIAIDLLEKNKTPFSETPCGHYLIRSRNINEYRKEWRLEKSGTFYNQEILKSRPSKIPDSSFISTMQCERMANNEPERVKIVFENSWATGCASHYYWFTDTDKPVLFIVHGGGELDCEEYPLIRLSSKDLQSSNEIVYKGLVGTGILDVFGEGLLNEGGYHINTALPFYICYDGSKFNDCSYEYFLTDLSKADRAAALYKRSDPERAVNSMATYIWLSMYIGFPNQYHFMSKLDAWGLNHAQSNELASVISDVFKYSHEGKGLYGNMTFQEMINEMAKNAEEHL